MAKEVVEVIGLCQSVRYTRVLIEQVGTSIRAQVYWNLFNPEGTLIAENKQSSCSKDYAHTPTLPDSVDFVNVVLMEHIMAQILEFTGEPYTP
jgi:hypothetical protein